MLSVNCLGVSSLPSRFWSLAGAASSLLKEIAARARAEREIACRRFPPSMHNIHVGSDNDAILHLKKPCSTHLAQFHHHEQFARVGRWVDAGPQPEKLPRIDGKHARVRAAKSTKRLMVIIPELCWGASGAAACLLRAQDRLHRGTPHNLNRTPTLTATKTLASALDSQPSDFRHKKRPLYRIQYFRGSLSKQPPSQRTYPGLSCREQGRDTSLEAQKSKLSGCITL